MRDDILMEHTCKRSEDTITAMNDLIDQMILHFHCDDPTIAAMIQCDLFRLMLSGQTKQQEKQTTMKLMHLLYWRLRKDGVSRLEIWKKVCWDEWI